MSAERRTHARRVLYSPEYLDMGADNGGVVVNLSEAGLAFQAVGPVLPESEVPLSFSLETGYRIDVRARVVWVSAEGKLGGAVFGKLSKDSQSLIREWLAKPNVEHEVEAGFVAPAPEQVIESAPERAPAVNPLTSAATMQNVDAALAEDTAAQNAVVLPSYEVKTTAEPSPTESFVQPGITAPPALASETVVLEPVIPSPPVQDPVTAPEPVIVKQPEVPATPSVEKQVAPAPLRTQEPKRERSSGGAYSVAPSISAWNRNDSPVAASASPTTQSGGPLFPPRNAENIFARSSHVEPERRGRASVALIVCAVVIAAGAIVALYARTHRQQIGNEITRLGNAIAGTPAATSTAAAPQTNTAANQAAPSANEASPTTPAQSNQTPPPVVSQAPAGSQTPKRSANHGATSPSRTANSPATPNFQPSQRSNGSASPTSTKGQASLNPPKSAASASTNASPGTPYSGQAEYERAENYLNGKGVEQDSAQAAEWFWRSLEAGNTSAAVPLADLYLAGNGVSRSCTQARILLDAAAQKNNATAIKKLAELPESCQ
jgi:hypothetical protein